MQAVLQDVCDIAQQAVGLAAPKDLIDVLKAPDIEHYNAVTAPVGKRIGTGLLESLQVVAAGQPVIVGQPDEFPAVAVQGVVAIRNEQDAQQDDCAKAQSGHDQERIDRAVHALRPIEAYEVPVMLPNGIKIKRVFLSI